MTTEPTRPSVATVDFFEVWYAAKGDTRWPAYVLAWAAKSEARSAFLNQARAQCAAGFAAGADLVARIVTSIKLDASGGGFDQNNIFCPERPMTIDVPADTTNP